MASTIDLACESCGKRYSLKPELAGKRVKCKCGQAMTVPAVAAAEDEGMYDLVDAAPKPAAAPARSRPTSAGPPPLATASPVGAVSSLVGTSTRSASAGKSPVAVAMPARASTAAPASARPSSRPVVAAGRGGAGALAYESAKQKDRFAYDNLVDTKRDVYFPTAILIIGVIGTLIWAIVAAQADSAGVALFTAFIGIKTLIKTAILIGLAVLVAPVMGISFGGFWSAVFKFAAIIVFADMLLLWMEEWIDSLGGASGRRVNIYIGLAKTALLGVFIAIQCRFLFDMDSEETGLFSFPMAFVNRVLDFVLWLVLVGVIEGITAAAAAPAVPTTPPPAATPAVTPAGTSESGESTEGSATDAGSSATTPAPPKVNPLAEQDAKFKELISRGTMVTEGGEFVAQFHNNPAIDVVFETIGTAGAKRVYFHRRSLTELGVIIDLPDDAEARKRVVDAANQMITRYAPDRKPVSDVGQRYLAFVMPAKRK